MTAVAALTPTEIRAARGALLAWYDRERRVLPWRAPPGGRPDPYAVWLSEIMLQQTTTPHAAPYFLAFTARWPTVADLAAAPDEAVMAAWAGLGYYARARNLLACARTVAAGRGGRFPETEEALRALPGVGAYTAAAIAAIAFDRAANVVDGNVERVTARLFAVEAPLPGAKRTLAGLAASLVGADRPGDWAQALMDLGSMVCRTGRPLCGRCPLAGVCRGRATGAPQTYPRRTARPPRPLRRGETYVLDRGGKVALVRRRSVGLLGGMLGLPTSDWIDAPAAAPAVPPAAGRWRDAGVVTHVFTHFTLELTVRAADWAAMPADFIWLDPGEALAAVPTVFRKALQLAWKTTNAPRPPHAPSAALAPGGAP